MSDVDVRAGWTSASRAPADALCPGRHLAQRGIPEPERAKDAAHGDRIHQALAGVGPDGERDTAVTSKLGLEERETFDACRAIEKKIVLNYFGNTKELMRVFRHQRQWVQVGAGEQKFMHSGEADVIYRVGTRLLIADYKTLLGDHTESSRNLQLRDLAVLAWGAMRPITEVATVIIQPFVTHSPEICIYTGDDLVQAQQEMFLRVAASNNPDSLRIPGEVQCNFCLAKTKCVEYQKWSAQFTPSALQELVYTAMDKWTPEQAAKAAAALGPAYDFLDNVKAWLKEHVPPGWTLAPGAIRETIINPQECWNRFEKLGGTLEQFLLCISIGKAKLKEQTSAVTGQTGLELEKKMKQITDGIVDVSQNAPSLKEQKAERKK